MLTQQMTVVSTNSRREAAVGTVLKLLKICFIMMTSFTSFKEGEIPLTVILVAVIYIGQQVYEGLFVQDNISKLRRFGYEIVEPDADAEIRRWTPERSAQNSPA